MTTIAYRDGIIAADSAIISGDDMVIGTMAKIVSGPDILAGASGSCVDCYHFLKWAKKGAKLPCPKFVHGLSGILIKGDKKYYINKEGGPFPVESEFMVTGSGEEMAMGAMRAGATAAEAVKIAIELDVYSGGEIRTLEL